MQIMNPIISDLKKDSIIIAADGGTIGFVAKVDGVERQCFLDRRIETKTYNEIFLDFYPAEQNAISIGTYPAIEQELEEILKAS